jgi:hypothetical protein
MFKIIFFILIFLLAVIAFFAIRSLFKKRVSNSGKGFDIPEMDLLGLEGFSDINRFNNLHQ